MDELTADSIMNMETRDNMTIARFSSHIILGGKIAEAIAEKLIAFLRETEQSILLLDCANVRSVTSLMLGKLIHLNNVADTRGKKFLLCNVSASVLKIMEVTKLDRLLTICPSEIDALARCTK